MLANAAERVDFALRQEVEEDEDVLEILVPQLGRARGPDGELAGGREAELRYALERDG